MKRNLVTHDRTALQKWLTPSIIDDQNDAQDHFVFDLDSTLFDVSPRIQKILREFAEISQNLRDFPKECAVLQTINTQRQDWGIRTALTRNGLTHSNDEFYLKVRAFWLEKFFSNDYLIHDQPYEGAVEFVRHLHNAGNKITYLTGRDHHRMSAGTLQVLKHHLFPIETEQTNLALKPHKDIVDTDFKTQWFNNCIQNFPNQNVWFFENEPSNILAIRMKFPQIRVVFFDSTHSGKNKPPKDIPVIENFAGFFRCLADK